MRVLISKECIMVAGACTVNVGGYAVNAAGIDCDFANIMANMYNYDLSTSGLIGYQPNGYYTNPYFKEEVNYLVLNNIQDDWYGLFNAALYASVPAHLIA